VNRLTRVKEIGKWKKEIGEGMGVFCEKLRNLAKEYPEADGLPVVTFRISFEKQWSSFLF
jgi:hypothetical protein